MTIGRMGALSNRRQRHVSSLQGFRRISSMPSGGQRKAGRAAFLEGGFRPRLQGFVRRFSIGRAFPTATYVLRSRRGKGCSRTDGYTVTRE